MIIAIIILGVVIIGLIVLINYISCHDNDAFDIGIWFEISLTILWVIEISIVSNIVEEPRPTAMDVYQGKTTLEYTIIDGIKVDSIVVFKENNYGTED